MSRGSPSMIALLGVLAVAGYQNRDKLSSMLQGGQGAAGSAPAGDRVGQTGPAAEGGLLENLRQMVSGAGGGGVMGGLSELLGRFSNPVQSAKAQSWVNTGPNGTLAPGDLDEVLDQDTIADLMQKTGLGRTELLDRLSAVLPEAVDHLTPNGRIPTEDEARAMY